MLTWDAIQSNAFAFSKRWKDGKNEKSESQMFVRDFLAIFGIEDPAAVGRFENPALREESHGFMDYFLPKKIAIEMKSKGKDLAEAYKQLKEYVVHLSVDEMPELLMVCDFATIVLYNRTTGKKTEFKTKDLHRHVKRFATLAGYTAQRDQERDEHFEVNVRAAERMALLHDELKEHGYEGHDLEIFLVRLLFCLFAGDTGIFPKGIFYNYIVNSKEDGSDLSHRLSDLFDVLNMTDETRAKRKLLSEELKQFRYINGRLFEHRLPPADFNQKMRKLLLECRSYDWSSVSPAIFGAMFQGVMDKDFRREIGAHYTSEENILKLVNPLFLDDLWQEFERVKTTPAALDKFHDKIANLKFLDPACGCGNFLIVTYGELRRLELEVLKMKISTGQKRLDVSTMLKVSIEQFYGIEIEDFPCQVAMVGMWLIDHQWNIKVSEHFGQYYARLPLLQCATIVHGNAHRIDWESVVPKNELSYIMGNPPFVGYQYRNTRQQEDMRLIFSDTRNVDYVVAWYYKATQFMVDTQIRSAFVSTNSITQGEQVASVWKPLIEKLGIQINFGYRTFRWSNEAKGKAAVHCVIIGFSFVETLHKYIFDGGTKIVVNNINPYLVDAPDIFVENRSKPFHNVPEMRKGNEMYDDQNLVIEADEYEDFIKREPLSSKYIKRYMGSDEFINNQKRYCLWLLDCPPDELRKMPSVMKRIEAVKKFRLNSKRESTKKTASMPSTFSVIHQPTTNYILFPVISSEKRDYIPIGFLSPETIVSYAVFTLSHATLYHFGILTSSVHMAWTRAVCGRLEMRYRYSNKIVYNNFPWPDATDVQKTKIEELAQAVLDARAQFPSSSLADLYDPLTMPPELLKAHQTLDRAVMNLYGFKKDSTEPEIVAKLMEMYQKLTERPTMIPKEIMKKKQKRHNNKQKET
jgi:hypothetical protein